MQQQLALALSQQAETVQRVEKSLREREQALGKVVAERLRPHREGDRPDRHRPARAAGPHRRGAEEDRRAFHPGRQPAGGPVQQAGPRRFRRGPAKRPGAERPAALGLRLPGDALDWRARRLSAEAAQPARLEIAIDAKFPLESYSQLRAVPAGDGAALLAAQRAFQQAIRKHIADIRSKYIVPGETAKSALMFPALGSGLWRAARQLHRPGSRNTYRARVWIVSPTTMMATLNTVRAVLKDVRMREQAGEIQKMVGIDPGRR